MKLDRRYHMIIGLSVFTGAITVCFLGLLLTLPHAQEISKTKTCAGGEVRSIKVSPELERGVLLDTTPAKIETIPAEASETTPSTAGKAATVIALGPVLGSMDSHKVETDLACTTKGVV